MIQVCEKAATEAKDLSGKMVTDIAVMLGTDKYPMLTIRSEAALIGASTDNINKVMIELESAKKTTAQLKDTLRQERGEGSRLKRKYEHVLREMESTKGEIHALQVEAQAKETSQEALENVQQEVQDLKNEKEQLREKVEDLEAQQSIIYGSNTEYTKELKEQLASLTAELETAKEQQVNLQPFKEYILAQKAQMLQLQTGLEGERFKVLQIYSRLEEIMETSSYFVDRS